MKTAEKADIIMPAGVMKVCLKERGARVEAWLGHCLTRRDMPQELRKAMEYSLLAGGKRLRPVLCLTTAVLCGAGEADVMPFAAAIEMIHTYSLIHDDLPAMDDDDLRRGKPSSHKVFGEATAILAGDALLTDAFSFMCEARAPAPQVLRAVAELASAAGSTGMVGGQVLDMQFTGGEKGQGAGGVARQDPGPAVGLDELRYMHSLKTGALIRASCVCGALLAGAPESTVQALRLYGAALGSAFQIADDILDVTADTATLGKPAGSDVEQGKCTYPSLLGLDRSRQLAEEQRDVAVRSLHGLSGPEAGFLRGLADYVVSRTA